MQLPGRLRLTTLGDLLGTLHRASATGTLELAEERGAIHRVFLARGLVIAVEIEGGTSSLAEILRRQNGVDDETLRRSLLRAMASRRLHGEVLVGDFRVSPVVVDAALKRQLVLRLSVLDQLTEARISFRVALRPPRGALVDKPLPAVDFLTGRRRAREKSASRTRPRARGYEGTFATSFDVERARARVTLGVDEHAAPQDIKRAYRRLVRHVHPDLHPHATDDERRELERRLVAATAAYQALVA
jgi:hypothetical protein